MKANRYKLKKENIFSLYDKVKKINTFSLLQYYSITEWSQVKPLL